MKEETIERTSAVGSNKEVAITGVNIYIYIYIEREREREREREKSSIKGVELGGG